MTHADETLKVALEPNPSPWRSITVHAPTEVLNDLELFQIAQQSVLRRVGCPTCKSGLHILWREFEEYVVDAKGDAQPIAPGGLSPSIG